MATLALLRLIAVEALRVAKVGWSRERRSLCAENVTHCRFDFGPYRSLFFTLVPSVDGNGRVVCWRVSRMAVREEA